MAFSPPFMRKTPMGAAFWAHQAKRMQATEGIKVPPSKAAADASVAGEGAAKGTNASTVSAPPALGEAADVSATEGVAAQDDVMIVGDAPSKVTPPAAAPTSAAEAAAAVSTRRRAATAEDTRTAAATA